MSNLRQDTADLYKARKGSVDFVDVPLLLYALVRGEEDPNGPAFAEALQALFTISYAAHFRLKKESGAVTHMMPLEALWWFDEPAQAEPVEAVAAGFAGMAGGRESWRWQAMMVQPEPIDEALLERAVQDSRPKHHEIYLGDPRRSAPEKLRTLIRHPVA